MSESPSVDGSRTLSRRDRERILARLREVEPAEWDSEGFSYPLALSLTTYLEERRGLDGLVRVLQRLGDGDDAGQALTAVYGLDYGELCRRWASTVLQEGMR